MYCRGDHALDVLDLDPLRLHRPDQIAHFALGHFQRHRGGVELAVCKEAVDRAFEIAAVMGDGLGEIFQHRHRHIEGGVMRLRGGHA